MLAMILAAVSIGARPVELVKPGEEAAYAAWLEGKARTAISTNAGKDCSTATLSAPQGRPPSPTDLVRQALPNAYAYYEMFAVAGCGPAEAQQILVLRQGDGWRAIALAPGLTVASLVLQRDLMQTVVGAVAAQVKMKGANCPSDAFAKSFRISDTRLTGPFVPGQPWIERWTARVCDVDYPVDLSLKPAADGGTDFSAHIP